MITYQEEVEKALDAFLPYQDKAPKVLIDAMRYSVLNGGKRLRAGFVYSVGHALGAPLHVMHHPAAAVEMIHAFSLIHDDLPAIDNDEIRRHKPTNHIVFGEAVAILAGDCLHARAFEILVKTPDLPAEIVLKMMRILTEATGYSGLIGGETYDVLEKSHKISVDQLMLIHTLKTAKLFQASILLGALSAQCNNPEILDNLDSFALNLGIAFQIQDDVIEVESSPDILGKSTTDQRNETNTAVRVMGLEDAKSARDHHYQTALDFLHKTRLDTQHLLNLSDKLIKRVA